MNGGGSSGKQQASSKSVGKQPCPQLLQVDVKGKERAGVVGGLFSPPPSIMARNRTMPVTRAEYESVPEWKLHCLCSENGGLPSPIKSHFGGCGF